jgi:hypothetical protein
MLHDCKQRREQVSDYTPTTEEVRNQYSGFSTSNSNHTGQVYLNFAEFDRWLEEVKAQVWDEAYTEGYRHGTCDVEPSDNPYRGENK